MTRTRLERTIAALSIVLTLGCAAEPPGCAEQEAWRGLMAEHLTRYEALGIGDLYKTLHQAALGGGHMVSDSAAAGRALAREMAALGEGPDEPLVDTLGAGGSFARIHLRPFRDRGGSEARLLAAFLGSAERGRGGSAGAETPAAGTADSAAWVCALETFRSMVREGSLPWPRVEVDDYLDRREEEGFPVVHHSDDFVRAHAPAYRVVAVELVASALAGGGEPRVPGPDSSLAPGR